MQFDLHAEWHHPYNRGDAARTQTFEGLFGGPLQSDGLERKFRAAAGQLLDRLDWVNVARVANVRRAHFIGCFEL